MAIRLRIFIGLAIFLFGLTHPVICQPTTVIPQDYDYSRITEVLLDAGYGWEQNSYFHPVDLFSAPSFFNNTSHPAVRLLNSLNSPGEFRFFSTDDSVGALNLYGKVGVELSQQFGDNREFDGIALSPFIQGFADFRGNWFARYALRSTNRSASLDHFSGLTRGISRAGMNASEIDRAAVGYTNSWALIEFGRGREIWGPLAEDNLVLSGHTPPWERLVLQASFKRLRYRYTFGFLESIVSSGTLPIQRYLVGRGLEYHNDRNLVLGISEVTILSGINRSIDMAHLNPVAIELEIEQNKRENTTENYTNAVWTTDFDWLPIRELRLSGTFLIDEIKLDNDNDTSYNQIAYLLRTAWTPIKTPICVTLYGKLVHIGTYTFNHTYRYGNFAFRGAVFGDEIGNDAEKFSLGLRLINNSKVMIESEYGFLRRGENSLLNDNYRELPRPQSSKFPSGVVQEEKDVRISALYIISKNIQFECSETFGISSKLKSRKLAISVRYCYP